jgi:hypothetical protein
MVKVKLFELIDYNGAEHTVWFTSEAAAVLTLHAMGMQAVLAGEMNERWQLPYGQANPGRIESALILGWR